MTFRTKIPIQKEKNQIDYNADVLLFGSCFSENIFNKLDYFRFKSFSNPFGILFNPIAIESLISNAINFKTYTEKDLFQLNEIWHCFDAHSDLSNLDKNELIAGLNSGITTTNQQLHNASHVVFTFGTSWVYRFIETDTIVGNCHKVPQKKFLKELLSVKKIIASIENCIALIKAINPAINIILTVSPVRHLKDGFLENSRSKSHLITALHELNEPRKSVHYFPSYEIMMDELRDYRFYNADMVHPNETAIDYIWQQFSEVWIADNTAALMKEVDSVQKGLAHRPFNPKSTQHLQFLESLNTKISNLKATHNITFNQ